MARLLPILFFVSSLTVSSQALYQCTSQCANAWFTSSAAQGCVPRDFECACGVPSFVSFLERCLQDECQVRTPAQGELCVLQSKVNHEIERTIASDLAPSANLMGRQDNDSGEEEEGFVTTGGGGDVDASRTTVVNPIGFLPTTTQRTTLSDEGVIIDIRTSIDVSTTRETDKPTSETFVETTTTTRKESDRETTAQPTTGTTLTTRTHSITETTPTSTSNESSEDSNSSSESSGSGNKNSGGEFTPIALGVGLGVGIPATIGAIGLIAFLFWRTKRRDKSIKDPTTPATIQSETKTFETQTPVLAEMDGSDRWSEAPGSTLMRYELSPDSSYTATQSPPLRWS